MFNWSEKFLKVIKLVYHTNKLTKREKSPKITIDHKGYGVSYNGSMYALGACGLGSIPSTPNGFMRVSYNGITRLFQSRDRGSTPLTRSSKVQSKDEV